MLSCKLFAYFTFLMLTIIWCIWLRREHGCINRIHDWHNVKGEMVVWLLGSVIFCLSYTLQLVMMRNVEGHYPWINDFEDDRHLQVTQTSAQDRRSLTENEINTIKRSRLFKHEQLN